MLKNEKKEGITIKHQNIVKRFTWGRHANSSKLSKCILSVFEIRNKNIKGLLNSQGNFLNYMQGFLLLLMSSH